MTTNQLLNLDYRDNDNRYTLVKALQLIPPLAKMNPSAIDMLHIEKALHIMCNKYGMFLKVQQDPVSGDGYDIWNCQIYSRSNLKLLGRIYGMCLDELFIKTAIAVYSEVRKQKKGVKTKK